MSNSRIPSPARSQGAPITPRRHNTRGPRSVGSPARSFTGRLSTVVQQFKDDQKDSFMLSPVNSRWSVLDDNTHIEEPRRKSWWKNLKDNTRDVLEVLESNKTVERAKNVVEEYIDSQVLSQEPKNYIDDLPESSDNESIASIVMPQRKLFSQKDVQKQNNFDQFVQRKSSVQQKSSIESQDKTFHMAPKALFGQGQERKRPVFPAALLNLSENKTINKTGEIAAIENKAQTRNLFGNRPGNKRKNMFVDFIMSESEDEIPDIQPKIFGFGRQNEQKRRVSSRGTRDTSPSNSIATDIEMDEWQHLPSSTMMGNQLEQVTPVKKPRLSKLSEDKETDSAVSHRTKDSNKSTSSRNKSKSPKEQTPDKSSDISDKSKTEKNKSLKNKSALIEAEDEVDNINHQSKTLNKSRQNKTQNNKSSANKSKVINTDLAGTEVIEEVIEQDKGEVAEIVKSTLNNSGSKTNRSMTKNRSINDLEELQTNVRDESKLLQKSMNLDRSHAANRSKSKNASKVSVNDNSVNVDVEDNMIHDTSSIVNKENASVSKPANKSITKNKSLLDDENNSLNKSKTKTNKSIAKDINKRKSDVSGVALIDKDKEVSDLNVKQKSVIVEDKEANKISKNVEKNVEMFDQQQENDISIAEESQKEELGEKVENEDEEVDESVNNTNEEEVSQDDAENDLDHESSRENADVDESQNEATGNDEIQNEGMENDEPQNEEVEIDESQNEEIEDEEDEIDESQNEDVENNESQNEEVENEATQNEENDEINNSQLEENDENEEEEDVEEEAGVEEMEEDNEQEISQEDQEMSDNEEDSALHYEEDNEVEDSQEQEENDTEEMNKSQEENNATHVSNSNHKDNSRVETPEAVLRDGSKGEESFEIEHNNTSVRIRKTKTFKNQTLKASLAPTVRDSEAPRNSIGNYTDGKDSSAEGSGWDSHRTTRKTLRQTLGRDFTPRKSLRALVMEKSAKRQTVHVDVDNTMAEPQANSTELPADSMRDDVTVAEPVLSPRTRQTTLQRYLMQIKQDNMEKRMKMAEQVKNSLNSNAKENINPFKVPLPPLRKMKTQSKPKKKAVKPRAALPAELVEDLKYKPPKRYQPANAPWITKKLYKFLESKLEPKYDYKARVRSEALVASLHTFVTSLRRAAAAPPAALHDLQREMARLDIVHTHFHFYQFFHQFMPREIRLKVIPDEINKIPLPKDGIYSSIL